MKSFSTAGQGNSNEECFDLKVVANGSQLLTCGSANCLRLWDISRGQIVNYIQSGSLSMYCIGLSHNEKIAVTGQGDSGLSLWNLN